MIAKLEEFISGGGEDLKNSHAAAAALAKDYDAVLKKLTGFLADFSEMERTGNTEENAEGVQYALDENGNYFPGPDEWGTAFVSQSRKGRAAVDFLLKKKAGFVPDAFTRSDLGGIDIVYGKTGNGEKDRGGYGLAHILKRHPDIDWNLFARVLETGTLALLPGNRIALLGPTKDGMIAVSLSFFSHKRKWVVTAYGNDLSHTSYTVVPAGSMGAGNERVSPKGNDTLGASGDIANSTGEKSEGSIQHSLSPVSDDALTEGPGEIIRLMTDDTSANAIESIGRWGYQMLHEMADESGDEVLKAQVARLDKWISEEDTDEEREEKFGGALRDFMTGRGKWCEDGMKNHFREKRFWLLECMYECVESPVFLSEPVILKHVATGEGRPLRKRGGKSGHHRAGSPVERPDICGKTA